MERHGASPNIVIIGAGVAGIGCAKTLLANGFTNVKILEARDRIGGRIYSVAHGEKSLDFGAQWIEGHVNHPLYQIALDNDLIEDEDVPLSDESSEAEDLCTTGEHIVDADSNLYFTQDGQEIPDSVVYTMMSFIDDMVSDFCPQRKALWHDRINTSLSVDKIFAEQFERAPLKEDEDQVLRKGIIDFFKKMEAIEIAESLDKVHIGQYLDYHRLLGSQWIRLKKGFTAVLNILLRDFPEGVFKYNAVVDTVTVDTHSLDLPVQIKLKNGEVVEADYCVVTVPLGVLKEEAIRFEPPLPDWKKEAINSIGFGIVDKIFIEFPRAWWPRLCEGVQLIWRDDKPFVLESQNPDVYKKEEDKLWYRYMVGFDAVYNHPKMLQGWFYGDWGKVIEYLPDEEIINVCFELLQRFTQKRKIRKPIRVFRTRWASDPYARGAYSFKQIGCLQEHFKAMAEPLPSEANPRLLFAGEATHAKEHASVHGAYKTGVREACRVINSLREQKTIYEWASNE